MRLELLRIVHLKKNEGVASELLESRALALALPGSFLIDSCLRRIWVCDENILREHGVPVELQSADVLEGTQAYEFLLRVACGLESKIPGETDIFGQVKEAWKKAELDSTLEGVPSTFMKDLSPWMQRLFEDTKEVRSQYLQNLGGASYGSLVRMILGRQPEDKREPVLLLGAGQLAKSIAPYLLETELWIANRSAEALARLHEEISPKAARGIRMLSRTSEIERAWMHAAQAVICVPFDPVQDAERIELWKKGGGNRPVVHLGGLREHCGTWSQLPAFSSLTEIFELESSQGKIRSAQLARAEKACSEKAKLRALGSTNIPHGWEDLAVFA